MEFETKICYHCNSDICLIVQLLSCVCLCATPWTTAHQAFLSFTISLSLLKPIELVMPSNHLILCRPLFLSSTFFRIKVFSIIHH